jgi:hypothetical protein
MDMDKMRRSRVGKESEAKTKRSNKDYDPRDMIGGENYSKDTIGVSYESIERITDKAVLLIISGVKKWVPKSMIKDADNEMVIVSAWWADKEGVEGF